MLMLRTWAKREKAYTGKKDPPKKKKKSNHYHKGLYQELLYLPHPICQKSARVYSTLCSRQTSDQRILMDLPPPPKHRTVNSRVQIQEKVATERGDGGKNAMNGFLISLLPRDGWRVPIRI